MLRVILESPFSAPDAVGIERNVRYARACLRDSLLRGEAPLASHLLYTQPGVLNDSIPTQRDMGIEAGLAWGVGADATVVYLDRGCSGGMALGIRQARAEYRNVIYRRLWPSVQIDGVTTDDPFDHFESESDRHARGDTPEYRNLRALAEFELSEAEFDRLCPAPEAL